LKNNIRFNWRKGTNSRQLIWKSSIPGIFLLLMIGLIFYVSSSSVQRSLSRQYFNNSSKATIQAIDQVYNPLLLLFKISSLWVQIGQIDDLGDPEVYGESLKSLIINDSLIQSMTFRDSSGKELDVYTQEDGDIELYLNEKNASETLNIMRESGGMSFVNEDGITGNSGNHHISPLKLSQSYKLPMLNKSGVTIYYRLYKDSESYIEIWIDFSLKQLASAISEYSINEDTVIFILLDSEDFVTYPIRDLLKIKGIPEEGTPFELKSNPLDIEIIQAIYNLMESPDSSSTDVIRISLPSGNWWTQYSTIELMDSSIVIGSYTPEANLLISRIQNPLIILLVVISCLIAFYFFFLFNDYRSVLQKQIVITEEEKVKQMIILGENLYCEFKSSMRWDYNEEIPSKVMEQVIMKSISAFSNSDGGTLLVGVRDDGEILGLEKDYSCLKEEGKDYFELHLRNLLSNMFGVAYPVSNIKVDFPIINGNEVCRINIRPGDQPLYIISSEKGSGKTEKFFVRSGNSSRQISSLKEITDYVMQRFT
jgi:Schlafen, AlbA_2